MAAILAMFVFSGCSGSRTLSHPGTASERHLEGELREEVGKWYGTPHRLGGTSRSGLDCSAFVGIVFRDLFGVDLPRSTEDQVRVGRQVERRTLQTGDLVFFRPSAKVRHVGIYLGDTEFAHVSTSAGVMISSLNEEYWRRRYWTARRVLPAKMAPQPLATENAVRTPVPKPDSARSGW